MYYKKAKRCIFNTKPQCQDHFNIFNIEKISMKKYNILQEQFLYTKKKPESEDDEEDGTKRVLWPKYVRC